jgi:DNA-binding transcriptional ArsR family regulator
VRAAAAISDDVRRQILEHLRGGPASVHALASHFPITRPAISRHLRVLRECGLVGVEARGRERWYHLDPAPLGELEVWLASFRSPWEAHLDALATEVARTRRELRSKATGQPDRARPTGPDGGAPGADRPRQQEIA